MASSSDWGCDDLRPLSPAGFSPSALLPIERVIKDRARKGCVQQSRLNPRGILSTPPGRVGQPLVKRVFSPCVHGVGKRSMQRLQASR